MKDNRRILFGLLLVQVACIVGAFATHGIVSIACWVVFAALFIFKYVVMFRRLKSQDSDPGKPSDPTGPAN